MPTSPFFQNNSQSIFFQGVFPLPDSKFVTMSYVYHGTPSYENVANILRYGWKPGTRCEYGTGIYFADWKTAKSYAGNNGYLIEAAIWAKESEIIDYQTIQKFPNCPKNGDGFTAYAQSRGYRVIRVNPSMYVVLAKNHSGPRHMQGVIIKGVYCPNTGQKIA
jgi:hypothetical protein